MFRLSELALCVVIPFVCSVGIALLLEFILKQIKKGSG